MRSSRRSARAALELFPAPPDWAPVILGQSRRAKPTSRAEGKEQTSRIRAYPPGLEWLSPDAHAMSNSWVIHGSRTASGRPILANDPHLAVEMPSVWWEVHVVSDTLNVAGRHHPGHSVRRHRPQRAHRLGADERGRRRAGFFRRAARPIAAALSCRRRLGAAGGPPPRDSRQRTRCACDLRRAIHAARPDTECRRLAGRARRRPVTARAARRDRARAEVGPGARRQTRPLRSMRWRAQRTGPNSSARFAASPHPLRTSCTPMSTATSATRCRDCCRFAPIRMASLPVPGVALATPTGRGSSTATSFQPCSIRLRGRS